MASYPQIEKILQDEVDLFNRDESKKKRAELEVKPPNSGRGNTPFGMRCVYNVFLCRLLRERVLSVSHDDVDTYFPASAIIRLHFRSDSHRDEAAVSAEHLAARLHAIFAGEEWDADDANA